MMASQSSADKPKRTNHRNKNSKVIVKGVPREEIDLERLADVLLMHMTEQTKQQQAKDKKAA